MLEGLLFQPLGVPDYPHDHAWHCLRCAADPERCGLDRDQLMERLKEAGTGAGLYSCRAHPEIYRERYPQLSLLNTEWNRRGCAPYRLFPDMTDADVDQWVNALSSVVESLRVSR